jgi:hypothetical protein
MATRAQQAHALGSHFNKLHKATLGYDYKGNFHREKWGYQDMLDDLGEKRAKAVIEWYFKTDRRVYEPSDLHRNYDRLAEAMDDYAADVEHQKQLMEATRIRVEEFRKRREENGNG